MNEPPPVLHRGTMYSWPIGWAVGSVGSGLLIRHGSSTTTVFPEPSHWAMLTGNTTGMKMPPVRAPDTAVATADAVNWLTPSTRANVVPKIWLPPTETPCAPGGIVVSPASAAPTCSASAGFVVTTPSGVSMPPVRFVY